MLETSLKIAGVKNGFATSVIFATFVNSFGTLKVNFDNR